MHGVPQMKLKVAIEDVKFLRATSLQKNQDITVTIAIHRGKCIDKIQFSKFLLLI